MALSGSGIGGGRAWVGKVFFLIALTWFTGVFLVMRPDRPHVELRPTPIVKLPDGTTHKVYLPDQIQGVQSDWLEKRDFQTQYTYTEFLQRPVIKFAVISLAVPMGMLAAALLWLAVAETRRDRSLDEY